jgi:hypothetical protein
VLIVEPAEQQVLTDAFDRDVPAGNWIVTEDQHSFVTLDHYPTPQAARQAFTQLPDLDGPDEDDGTTAPAGPLGARYAVALGGRFLDYADAMDKAAAMQLEAGMREHFDRVCPFAASSEYSWNPTCVS